MTKPNSNHLFQFLWKSAFGVGLLCALGTGLSLSLSGSSYQSGIIILYIDAIGTLVGFVMAAIAYGVLFSLRRSRYFRIYPGLVGFLLGLLNLAVLGQFRISSFQGPALEVLLFPILPWLLSTLLLHYLAVIHIQKPSLPALELKSNSRL